MCEYAEGTLFHCCTVVRDEKPMFKNRCNIRNFWNIFSRKWFCFCQLNRPSYHDVWVCFFQFPTGRIRIKAEAFTLKVCLYGTLKMCLLWFLLLCFKKSRVKLIYSCKLVELQERREDCKPAIYDPPKWLLIPHPPAPWIIYSLFGHFSPAGLYIACPN